MTNEEKYKTPEERKKAFDAFYEKLDSCLHCPIAKEHKTECVLHWLALEAEEENPLPCPFCGGVSMCHCSISSYVYCTSCGAQIKRYETKAEAVAAWNRRAK